MKYHGVAYGMYTADEHINGSNPTQGTTLTAVCETAYLAGSAGGDGGYAPRHSRRL